MCKEFKYELFPPEYNSGHHTIHEVRANIYVPLVDNRLEKLERLAKMLFGSNSRMASGSVSSSYYINSLDGFAVLMLVFHSHSKIQDADYNSIQRGVNAAAQQIKSAFGT